LYEHIGATLVTTSIQSRGGSTGVIDLRGGDPQHTRVEIVYQKPADGGGLT
jgi:hypothetical protein